MSQPYPEAGAFPDQHTTSTYTTTTQVQAPGSPAKATLDQAYPLSLQGILKIVQIIIGFLYWTVVASYSLTYGFVLSVAITAWVFTLLLFLLYLFSLQKQITIINWPLTGLLNNAAWCLLHFVAAIMISIWAGRFSDYAEHGKLVWGSLCGWTLFVLYGITAFFDFREFQATGGFGSLRTRSHATTTTTTTSTTVIASAGQPAEPQNNPPPYPGGPFK